MKKIIDLKLNSGRVEADPYFIVHNDKLDIELHSEQQLDNCYLSIKNGEIKETYFYNRKYPFEIPKKFLKKGCIFITVTMKKNGETLHTWNVEPIVVKEVDNGEFEFHKQMESLITRVSILEKKLVASEQRITELEEIIEVGEI